MLHFTRVIFRNITIALQGQIFVLGSDELGRNPVSKHQIQPEYGDEQADAGRDG